jgi:pimeloyl-ACP methyl ester carboxylesterase
MRAGSFLALLLLAAATAALAEPCATDDFESRVTGVSQCLLMRRYGPADPAAMVVWLHGDVSAGGPANYHFPIAQKAAGDFAADRILSIALVRPGYPDGSGESSSVSFSNGGRSDHYTRENIGEVGAAIEKLRSRFKPQTVILVGHSGGAATAAVLLGMRPQLAEAAVLVSCPCEIGRWRAGRRSWERSENPLDWAARTAPSARVIALTGSADDNTSPALAKLYVDALSARGVDAAFAPVEGATHNSAFRSAQVSEAIARLIRR